MSKETVAFTIDSVIMAKVRSKPELKGKLSAIVENTLKSIVDNEEDINKLDLLEEIKSLEEEAKNIYNKLSIAKTKLSGLEQAEQKEHKEQLKRKKDMLKALRNGGGLDD